ncbi:MAG TPA: hypothetical protein VF282_03885 [Bacillota bacterium]
MTLRSKPGVLPWLLAAALTALLAGSLFRAYTQTDVAFFRMFGTIGVVLVGVFATRAFYALQERDALQRLEQVLDNLPAGFTAGPAVELGDPETGRPLVVDLVVVGKRSLILVGIDATRPVASAQATRVRLQRLARRLWRARRLVQNHAGDVPVTALALTLYRDADAGGTYIEGLPVVTAERLPAALQEVDAEAGDKPLPPALLERLLQDFQAPSAAEVTGGGALPSPGHSPGHSP